MESDVALEGVSWSTWWVDSWVEAGISGTAASGESLFDSGAVVVQSKLPAGGDWVASVDGSVGQSSVVHGRESGRSTLSLASLPSSSRNWGSVDEETRVASNWIVSLVSNWSGNVDLSSESGQINVAVVVVVTAASSNITINGDGVALVVELKSLTELLWNASEDRNGVVVNSGTDGSALSGTSNLGSGGLSLGIDSSEAVAESRWVGLILGWVNAEISVTAASGHSWLWGGTMIVHVEGLADSRWVTSIEDSGVGDSSNGGVQSDGGALSLACSEGDWGGWHSVDVKSGVTSDGKVSSSWWWRWGDGSVGDVAVVDVVTAASHDLVVTPDWFAVVVELKRVTDRVWNTVVGVDLVSVDDSGKG